MLFLNATTKLLRYGRMFYSTLGAAIPASLWVFILPNAKCGAERPAKYADDRIRTDTGIPSGFKPDAFSNYATSAKRSRQDSNLRVKAIPPTSYLADRWHKPLAHTTILFCCQTETQGFEPWDQISGLQFSRLPR